MEKQMSAGQESVIWTGLSEVLSFDFNLKQSCSL